MLRYMFCSNIVNIYGKNGRVWLDQLPDLVAAISLELGLRDLKEVTNLTHNYVLSGFQDDNPIILKLGLDHEALTREGVALKYFAGCGAVKVISEDKGILLLEKAVPGISLKNYFPDKEQESIVIACKLIKKLHDASIPRFHNFSHIKDWLTALDKDSAIPDEYMQKAKKLRDHLLITTKPDVLLHGDLHHDNMLQHGDNWMVIDPKGVIGEQAYELAAFIRNPMPELLNHTDARDIIENRIKMFSDTLNMSATRILYWCFVQAVLAWVWAIEDGCDAHYFKQISMIFNKITKGI